MNVAKIHELTHNTALEAQALEARQWAIITNSIRELTHAIGYNGPFRDNDMRVAMAIKQAAARLYGPEATPYEEHLPLAIAGTPTSPEIERVHDILEKGLEAALRDSETSAAASAPVEPASPPRAPKPVQAKA